MPKSQQTQKNGGKSQGGLGNQMRFNLSPPLAVTSGKSLPLSSPQFLHLYIRDNNSTYLQGWVRRSRGGALLSREVRKLLKESDM